MILHTNRYWPLIIGFLLLTGCKKLIEIQDPKTQISAAGVYSSDANAQGAINGLYSQMYAAGAWGSSATTIPGLSADEITAVHPASIATYSAYFNNQIISNDGSVAALWTDFYKSIYNANAIIEGVAGSTGMTEPVKKQFTGEARFMRAINHFYLVNLFGPVPLILSTDVKQTVLAPRADSATIYNQIITDLTEAQNLLPADYSASGTQRTRVNKFVAAALLARVYLHTGNFAKAEEAANVVIGSPLYGLLASANMNGINLKNNKEAIFQLDVSGDLYFKVTSYLATSFVPSGPSPAAFVLRPELVSSFEAGDLRLKNWTGKITWLGTEYYYPFKYQQSFDFGNPALNEYHTVLRLNEQYLVRAEARAKQSNLAGGLADLNTIRNRAGLADATASAQSSLINLIMHERQVELFCEHGLRWLDLKRTGTVDAVIGAIKPTYKPFQKWYPVPIAEMQKNPALIQNPGY